MARFESLPGRGDRWLVRHGRRRFTVPADLGARLQGPGGERLWRDLLARHAADRTPPRRSRGLWLRVTLLPAVVVRPAARLLAPLTAGPCLGAMAAGGLAALVAAPRPPAGSPATWPAILAAFMITALVHELGHAAALRREGWPPGRVGVGLLWVLPVCWCDVSAVALLPRPGRVRVDLAGVAFQLAAVGVLAVAAGLAGWRAGSLGAGCGAVAVAWSLLPLARTDGYWLACDLFGLPDLAAPLPGRPGRARRLAATAWRGVTALLLMALVVALPWRLRSWLGAPGADPDPPAVIVRGVVVALLLVGAARTLRRVGRLLGAVRRDLGDRSSATVVRSAGPR